MNDKEFDALELFPDFDVYQYHFAIGEAVVLTPEECEGGDDPSAMFRVPVEKHGVNGHVPEFYKKN